MEKQSSKEYYGPWSQIEEWAGKLWAGNFFLMKKLEGDRYGNTIGNTSSRYGDKGGSSHTSSTSSSSG